MHTHFHFDRIRKIRTGDLLFNSVDDFSGYLVAIGTHSYITHLGIYVWIVFKNNKFKIIEHYAENAILTVLHMVRCKCMNLILPPKLIDGKHVYNYSNSLVLEPFSASLVKRFDNAYLRKCNMPFEKIRQTLVFFINNHSLFKINTDVRSHINMLSGLSFAPNYGFSCSHFISVYLHELCDYNPQLYKPLGSSDTIRPTDIFACSTPILGSEQITIYESSNKDSQFIHSEMFITSILLVLLIIILVIIYLYESENKFLRT